MQFLDHAGQQDRHPGFLRGDVDQNIFGGHGALRCFADASVVPGGSCQVRGRAW
jgi:hypothetical protein